MRIPERISRRSSLPVTDTADKLTSMAADRAARDRPATQRSYGATIIRMHPAEMQQLSRRWRNPPDWFNDKRYAYLRGLRLSQWQYEIQRCRWLIQEAQPGGWKERPSVPSYIGPPTVQLIPKGNMTLHRLEKPALIVQLEAPDGILVEEFKKALKLARVKYPAPVTKPGPKSSNAEFTRTQISTWLSYKIVPLAELDNWRMELRTQNGATPTDADFGRWLFHEWAQPGKEIVTARRVLRKAIANIPALWAQVEGTAPG
jgi:hypothetical protein